MKDIKISVYCLAYNCVNFIEKSINSILNQNIAVEYKIIIHDDASSDGSAEIIKKYADMYPDKICAILQSENQYSKGVDIYQKYIVPNLEGDYVAICEGDDYWIDENKLQLQYDYMERHPECSLCTHNTEICDCDTGKRIKKFNNWETIHILTEDEVFLQWCVHTSSYFGRRDHIDWPGNNYTYGDSVILTWAFYKGTVVCLPETMSVYNFNNPNGVTRIIRHSEINEKNEKERERIKYLNEYNDKTQYKYNEIVKKRIQIIDFYCLEGECDNIILHSNSKLECIDAAKKLRLHEYYKKNIQTKKGLRRLIKRYRYEGYFFYPLWKFVMKNYLKNRR